MKLLVTVSIPAISESYDIRVPISLRIKSIAALIAGTVEELSNYRYVASGEECLCSVEKNILLRPNARLDQYGIQNGDHLILM